MNQILHLLLALALLAQTLMPLNLQAITPTPPPDCV